MRPDSFCPGAGPLWSCEQNVKWFLFDRDCRAQRSPTIIAETAACIQPLLPLESGRPAVFTPEVFPRWGSVALLQSVALSASGNCTREDGRPYSRGKRGAEYGVNTCTEGVNTRYSRRIHSRLQFPRWQRSRSARRRPPPPRRCRAPPAPPFSLSPPSRAAAAKKSSVCWTVPDLIGTRWTTSSSSGPPP